MIPPRAVVSMYDKPMWDSIEAHAMKLQRSRQSGRFRYPPGPIDPTSLDLEYDWEQVSGRGTILSWVVFHRQYLDEYPAPYNVIAVQLEEGPIVISNLVGPEPEGSWIDRAVELVYEESPATGTLPRFRLAA